VILVQDTIKSTQEQAIAAWIERCNFLKLQEFAERLSRQDINLEAALMELEKLKLFISAPQHILGSMAAKHGEIAEHTQVRFVNAEELVVGKAPSHTFEGVGRTAPEDYLCNGKLVQSKFYFGPSGTLHAINEHLNTYPWFINEGGSYDIPKNHFQELIKIYSSGEANATMSTADAKLYAVIKEWELAHGVRFPDVVHPAVVSYDDVQLDTIHRTVQAEEVKIQETDQQVRNQAYIDTKPTIKEGTQITATAAILEGGITFAIGVYRKKKAGKKIVEFTVDDWKELGVDTCVGTVKGAIRGGSIYLLTNFTPLLAPVASAMITATFGMLSQSYKFQKGEVTSGDFVDSCEMICLDVTVSALSSILGGVIIPIPILGAVIGNTVGMFMNSIAKTYLSAEEQRLILAYQEDMAVLTAKLDDEYKSILEKVNSELNQYESLAALAFSEDVNVRFDSSIMRAKFVGVSEDRILTRETGEALFTSNEPITL